MLAIAVARRLTQRTVDNVLGPSVMFIDSRHSEEPLTKCACEHYGYRTDKTSR